MRTAEELRKATDKVLKEVHNKQAQEFKKNKKVQQITFKTKQKQRYSQFLSNLDTVINYAVKHGKYEAHVFRFTEDDGIELFGIYGAPDMPKIKTLKGVPKKVWKHLESLGLNPKLTSRSEISSYDTDGGMHTYRYHIYITATWK